MKIFGNVGGAGTVKVFGRIEGDLQGAIVLISDGAQVDGDVVADDSTSGGRVKGNIHANRVKLDNTATVEGDIFHRSLLIEQNARFEGSSRREENVIEISPQRRATADIPIKTYTSQNNDFLAGRVEFRSGGMHVNHLAKLGSTSR